MFVVTNRNKHVFVATKHFFLDKSMRDFVTTKVLSRQEYFRRTTKTCYFWQLPPMSSLSLSLSQYHWRELPQVSFLNTRLPRQNTSFVATKVCLSRQNVLSRQNYVCCDKRFVVTSIFLSRQKLYLWQLPPMKGFQGGGGLNVCEFHEAETEVWLGSLLQRR